MIVCGRRRGFRLGVDNGRFESGCVRDVSRQVAAILREGEVTPIGFVASRPAQGYVVHAQPAEHRVLNPRGQTEHGVAVNRQFGQPGEFSVFDRYRTAQPALFRPAKTLRRFNGIS